MAGSQVGGGREQWGGVPGRTHSLGISLAGRGSTESEAEEWQEWRGEEGGQDRKVLAGPAEESGLHSEVVGGSEGS